jgi:hypothetical protein
VSRGLLEPGRAWPICAALLWPKATWASRPACTGRTAHGHAADTRSQPTIPKARLTRALTHHHPPALTARILAAHGHRPGGLTGEGRRRVMWSLTSTQARWERAVRRRRTHCWGGGGATIGDLGQKTERVRVAVISFREKCGGTVTLGR